LRAGSISREDGVEVQAVILYVVCMIPCVVHEALMLTLLRTPKVDIMINTPNAYYVLI
jgi:hypothetical protein